MSEHFIDRGEHVAIREDMIQSVLYGFAEDGPHGEFQEEFDVVQSPRGFFEADPKEVYHQGISAMSVIRRISDGRLFGHRYLVFTDHEDSIRPNGKDFGLGHWWYVFEPVEEFVTIGYQHTDQEPVATGSGHRSSPALTEARTVRSRALSAIARLDYLDQDGYPHFNTEERDPEHDAMRAALVTVARILEPFKKN